MNELSIEEKAKAYDELKVKAQELTEDGYIDKLALLDLFPELKEESEDERVRKELIEFVDANTLSTDERNGRWIAWLEKQGEQKPADKVEPKFHEGEWVVYECGEETATLQIKRIVEETYEFSDDSNLGVVDEDTLRLWDVTKDAKAGDVLHSPCCKLLWIYKDEKTCYVGSNLNYNSGSIVINKPICIPTDVQPATKEQRDTLEKAMADAGYTFDFEKKELKKIEQKPAWSEEDEKMIEAALQFAHEYGRHGLWCWLKSLRPRSHWKPSDEQIEALDFAADCIVPAEFNIKRKVLKGLLEQLKKLKG